MTDGNTVIFILGGRQIPLPCAHKSYIFLQSFIASEMHGSAEHRC